MLTIKKWERRPDTRGINRHQEWGAVLSDGSEIHVSSDEDVLGDKWYLSEEGRGEGCGTIWYPAKEAAAKSYIKHGKIITGQDSGFCKKCACSYSHGTRAWKKYRDWACAAWKRKEAKLA